jgi:ElaB/YqjD/DUF883 family membrane-anchored ribosome-binding protein
MSTLKNKQNDLYEDVEKLKAALTNVLENSVDEIKEKTTDATEKLASYATEKPFRSLSVALLVGIGIGYFLRKY